MKQNHVILRHIVDEIAVLFDDVKYDFKKPFLITLIKNRCERYLTFFKFLLVAFSNDAVWYFFVDV